MPPAIPYALIGHPIESSPSPVIHNAAFQALGMNASYRLRPTNTENIEEVIAEIKHGKWVGLNVTTPLKTAFAPLVKLQGHAVRAQAVNTMWRYGAEIHGALTDVDGVLDPLKDLGYTGGGHAVIIGGGGAARAAAIALDSLGATIHTVTRNPDKAKAFQSIIKPRQPGETIILSDQEALKSLFGEVSVIVQATPVGTDNDHHNLPWSSLNHEAIAFEMVYAPVDTPFVQEAKKIGCRVVEGWKMLIAQGAASQRIWTGRQPPVEAMSTALRAHLGI